MKQGAGWLRACLMGATGALALGAGDATGQETRVLLIRPADAKAVPVEALGLFRQAILDALPDAAFVTTVAQATDVVELTRYTWSPYEEPGVSQSWHFQPRRLDPPDDPLRAWAPTGAVVIVWGRTLAEGTQAAPERLRTALEQLFRRQRPGPPR